MPLGTPTVVNELVTVSRADLSDSALTFIRDVLRNELNDPNSGSRTSSEWVWQSRPEADFDPPFVVIDEVDHSRETIGINARGKFLPIELTYEILVWARKIANRDSVADEVIETLSDRTAQDSNSNDLESQGLIFQNSNMENADTTVGQDAKTMRIKSMTVTFRYVGG